MTKKTKIWLAIGGGILFVGAMNAKAPPKRNRAHAAQEKAPEATAPPPASTKAPETAPDAGEAPPPQTPLAKTVAVPEPPPAPPPAKKLSLAEGWAKLRESSNTGLSAPYWDNPQFIRCNADTELTENLWAMIPRYFPAGMNEFERQRNGAKRQAFVKQIKGTTLVGRIKREFVKVGTYNFHRKGFPVTIRNTFWCGQSHRLVDIKLTQNRINILVSMAPEQAERFKNRYNSLLSNYISSGNFTADIAFRPLRGHLARNGSPEIRAKRLAIRIREGNSVWYDSEQDTGGKR